MRKMIKANGFPTRYAYACGDGKHIIKGDDSVSIFENDSHTCIDVKYFIGTEHGWFQFFHWDNSKTYNAIHKAEKTFNRLKKKLEVSN